MGDRLHHVGFVVASIDDSVERFIAAMGLHWDGQVFHDPIQTVRVTFLQNGTAAAPMVELVEPASPRSHVAGFLKRGGGLHHLCYEVDSLDARIESALAAGAVLLRPPAEAVAFDGRRIAWVCTPDRLFIEYLERGLAAPLS